MRRALLVAVVGLLVGASAPVAAQPLPQGGVRVSDEARRHFDVGVKLLDDPTGPRFAEAYEAFRRAYSASPSPLILSNLGLCAMRLERDGEAISAYERYLRQVTDIGDAERQRIEADLQTLRSRSATLIIYPQPASGTLVDRRVTANGAPAINRYQVQRGAITLVVHAGQHELYLEGDASSSPATSVVVAAGEQKSVTLSVPPPVEPMPPSEPEPPAESLDGLTVPTVVLLGITGALGAVTLGTGIGALATQSDYKSALDEERRVDAVELRERGEILNGVTDGFMVGTIVMGSVALGFLIRDAVLIGRTGEAPAPALNTGFWAGPNGGGMSLQGRF